MQCPNFREFLLESLELTDRLELVRLGLSDEGWRVLKCRVDWENVGQKRFDGTAQPFMRCSYYPNWPLDLTPSDVWSEYPDSEITRRYLNDEGGDVELVDELMMELAQDWDADLLWSALDGDWFEVGTGEPLPKLHKLI